MATGRPLRSEFGNWFGASDSIVRSRFVAAAISLKLVLNRSQQVMAPAGTLGGHQWIAAGDQPSARIGRVANLGEVALIER